MNLHLVEKTVALAYDGTPLWPVQGPDPTGPYTVFEASLPPALVHRRLWLGAFIDVGGADDSSPQARFILDFESEDGSLTNWFDWRLNYTPGMATPGGGSGVWPDFTGIRPPFNVTNQQGFPDRAAAEHSGAGDARVMQFMAQVAGPDLRNTRMTMWPVDITARLRRMRLTIRDFTVTGTIVSGQVQIGLRMQSQAFPY